LLFFTGKVKAFPAIAEKLEIFSGNIPTEGILLYLQLTSEQNSLSQEQLECLEKLAVTCATEDKETVLSIIHEFGPYCEKLT
jgi:hypothetical protein